MKYTTVTNPVFSNETNTTIDCVVDFERLGEVPFTASPTCDTVYGKQIFVNCLNGEYGPVGEYVPPPAPEPVEPV